MKWEAGDVVRVDEYQSRLLNMEEGKVEEAMAILRTLPKVKRCRMTLYQKLLYVDEHHLSGQKVRGIVR